MKKNLNKIVTIVLAVALLGMTIVAGTLAYLHAKTNTITNTFTVGDGVVIALAETGANEGNGYTKSIDYVPAMQNVAKDPTITVSGRECWVFVGIKTTAAQDETFDTFVSYSLDDAKWNTTPVATLSDGTKIYAAKALSSSTENSTLTILKGNVVNFNNVDEMPTAPLTMQFTGYAIQTSEAYDEADEAWAALDIELGLTPPVQG